MRLPVPAKQAWEQEVVIASLFCHRTSPQAQKRGRAEPGLGGDVTTLMTIPGPGITWPIQLTLPTHNLKVTWPGLHNTRPTVHTIYGLYNAILGHNRNHLAR